MFLVPSNVIMVWKNLVDCYCTWTIYDRTVNPLLVLRFKYYLFRERRLRLSGFMPTIPKFGLAKTNNFDNFQILF